MMSSGGMDAVDRAELDALRRRAYAADADIATDPVALARLVEFEDRLHRPAEQPAEPVQPAQAAAQIDAPPAPAVRTAVARSAVSPPPSRRRGWHLALVAVIGATAFVLGVTAWAEMPEPIAPAAGPPLEAEAADALAFANDPEATLLYTLHLDGAFGTYVDPYPSAVPNVPIDGPVWASSLGEYYGFVLWIVGSVRVERTGQDSPPPAEERLCIALTDGESVHSRCVGRAAWEQGALLLAVDFDELTVAERPVEMRSDQSLGMWWTDDDRIRVVLGRRG